MAPPPWAAIIAGRESPALWAGKGPRSSIDFRGDLFAWDIDFHARHRPQGRQPQERRVQLNVAHPTNLLSQRSAPLCTDGACRPIGQESPVPWRQLRGGAAHPVTYGELFRTPGCEEPGRPPGSPISAPSGPLILRSSCDSVDGGYLGACRWIGRPSAAFLGRPDLA